MRSCPRFPFTLPANWCVRMGYNRSGRNYVAFFFSPTANAVIVHDGELEIVSTGANFSWNGFFRQQAHEAFLIQQGIKLGSPSSAPTHWLVVDRQFAHTYLPTADAAGEIIRMQSLGGSCLVNP